MSSDSQSPSTEIVRKSNHLVEASYKLTLNEQRLVLYALTQIKPMRSYVPEIKVSAREFGERMKLTPKASYEALEDATNNLYERDIRTNNGTTVERFRWVSSVKYHKGDAYVTLRFTSEIAPYLTNLRARFTQYNLEAIAGLNQPTTIRIFELLMQWKTTKQTQWMALDEFKDRLGLNGRYPRFFDLKKRVLDPAAVELRRESGIELSWELEHRGRTVTGLRFSYKESDQMSLPLENAAGEKVA